MEPSLPLADQIESLFPFWWAACLSSLEGHLPPVLVVDPENMDLWVSYFDLLLLQGESLPLN